MDEGSSGEHTSPLETLKLLVQTDAESWSHLNRLSTESRFVLRSNELRCRISEHGQDRQNHTGLPVNIDNQTLHTAPPGNDEPGLKAGRQLQ